MSEYRAFLEGKIPTAVEQGFEVDPAEVNPALKDFVREAVVPWAASGGRRAIFSSFGLHKTSCQIELARLAMKRADAVPLIVLPLGVRHEFLDEAEARFRGDHAVKLRFIRRTEEADERCINITNYESAREGKIDGGAFDFVSLDEAAILRGFGGTKTFREFMRTFGPDAKGGGARFRYVATATPDPNEYVELLAYADFLGVMDIGQGKTRWFKRDSEKADKLTLHAHKEREFWLWVASWALFLRKPSDLGYSDEGYTLPALDVRWHEVATDHAAAGAERDGQARMFRNAAIGIQDAAAEKRGTIDRRVEQLVRIIRDASIGRAQSLSAGVAGEEPGGPAGKAAGIQPSPLPGEQRGLQGAGEGLEGSQSRTHEGASTGSSRSKRGEAEGPKRQLVSGEQGPCERAIEGPEAGRSRAHEGGLPEDARRAERGMRDLLGAPAEEPKALCGPLPSDRCGSGFALPEVQRSAGPSAGQPGGAGEGERVPDQLVIWCDLNAEQKAVDRALADVGISASSLYGNQDIDDREKLLRAWRAGSTDAFVSKPMMYGAGINMQQAHTMIFVGIGHKFHDFVQAVHRCQRFGQKHPVTVHLIHTEAEREIRKSLEAKWKRHEEQGERMAEIIRQYGLAGAAAVGALARTIGVRRHEASGEGWRMVNADTVDETAAMEPDSVGLIVTSIPFSTQYEYTPSYNDFGHCDSNAQFWEQMDFLTPSLLRVLQPGRMMAVHVKDRIVPGGLSGLGFQTVYPMHADAIAHYKGHGFAYFGMKTVVTDVVRENNQTYRLGWSEQCKDGSRMGPGMPEYILLFRKPPTDRSNGYADVPVLKAKPLCDDHGEAAPFDPRHNWRRPVPGTGYSRARWQLDAHAFARSSGNRLLTDDELRSLPHDQLYKLWRIRSTGEPYDFEGHVTVCEALDHMERLPATFMLFPPHSWHEDVWADVARMRTLNGAQHAAGRELHLCLARGSRVLTRERGYVPIESVRVGEHALTHKGRWRPVLAVQQTGTRPVVTIRAQGVPGLTLTPDHKLWVRKSDWVRERDGAEYVAPGWEEASACLGGYVNLKLPEATEPEVSDLHHWWIVGRWLADGHWETRGSAIVSCGDHEKGGLLASLGDRAGGTYKTGTAWQIRVRDRDGSLKRTLRECGAGAGGKHLPPVAYTLPSDQASALLEGYLSGDGHHRSDRGRWMTSSVSRDLLLGIAVLAQRVHGAIASLYAGRPERSSEIQGRSVMCRQDWILSFDIDANRRKKPFVLDDGAWKKVRSIEPAGDVETWNIRVEEDESYTAEGCVVKNCPMQFDIVDRLVLQLSMEGETVFDPFAGIGTVPLRALQLGRRGLGVELNAGYFADACDYLAAAERDLATPSLFDLLEAQPEAAE